MRNQKNVSLLDIVQKYKLYNPNSNKVIISRNVTFDEESKWSWNQGDEVHVKVTLEVKEEIYQEIHMHQLRQAQDLLSMLPRH